MRAVLGIDPCLSGALAFLDLNDVVVMDMLTLRRAQGWKSRELGHTVVDSP